MSNEQEHTEEHNSPIKTPKQLAVTIVLAFIIPIVIIFLLVSMVTSGTKVGAGSGTLTEEAIARRIAPVAGFELVDANAPRVFKTGEQVYQSVCMACHAAGVANAPKMGDANAWAPFIKTGFEAMLNVAIHGKGAMPAKGGNPALSDFEVARAVVYMANQSGGKLPEPPEPKPEGQEGASAAAAPAAAAPAASAPAVPAAAQAPAQAPAPAQPDAPAGAVPAGAAPAPANTATANAAGEKLYKSTCFACHGTGVANAPRLGDKAAWAPYIATGMDEMLKVVKTGKGAMPPKGGAMNASDEDLRAAVEYMVSAAK
ncbi:c-type cytochrome [Pseudomonadota bacterium AL_CKDN230030165-1A_HGKHYDSX7]